MKEMRVRVTTLESTWGNFNNWVLELRDGKQIVIPPSLHHSPGSILDFQSMKEMRVRVTTPLGKKSASLAGQTSVILFL